MSKAETEETLESLNRSRPNELNWVPVENYGLKHNPFAKMNEKARKIITKKVKDYKHYKIFGRKKEVPLSAIKWTLQARVDEGRVAAYSRGEGERGKPMVLTRKDITVIEYENSYLLLDGNHRICALRESGAAEDTILSVIAV